jgi:glycosyltransferase involved in cell wall biosynthesis
MLGALNLDPDSFVVGMVAANKGNAPPRKSFPQVFEAFKTFHERHPDSLLYLHTMRENHRDGLDLPMLAKAIGVPQDAILYTPEFELQMGVPEWKMAYVYSNMDVLCAPSYGEGFGIPIVEAQACGVPVIVNDWTAMPELAGPAQWVTEGDRWYNMSQGSWFKAPRVESILARLEDAYDARGDTGLSAGCRSFAEGYDARRVMAEHWAPVLDVLEERLAEKRTDAPLPAVSLNRAARRRQQKTKAAA